MARCLIGCGSNQAQPQAYLADALELLRSMPGITVVTASRPRKTRPIGGPPGQPAFLNGAFLVDTDLPPQDVFGVLSAIENTLHRERLERWGPRTIDLDLLLYDDVVLDHDDLTVPHPRMTTRRFVLEPCVEIAPDLVHPVSGRSMRELLGNISSPHPHVAVVGVPGSGAAEIAATLADALLARLVHAPLPLPLPGDNDFGERWEAALADCAAALHARAHLPDAHGTVADFWLGAFLAAADGLLPADVVRRTFSRLAGDAAAPNVVLLLHVDAAVLEERLAFRSRTPLPQTDMFLDLSGTAIAVEDLPAPDTAATVAHLMALQARLTRRLTGPANGADRPPAVVVIRADDLAAAVGEALAAVEAMA